MKKLQGKIALVTGAAAGMGAAHARLLIKEGAKVILTDLQAEKGSALAEELGENALFIHHNVANEEDWINVIKISEEKFGNITILVNNAGIIGPKRSICELTQNDFEKIISINQTSIFLGMKHVIPLMLKAGIGSIINISSVAGFIADQGASNIAYTASKFAIRGMTKMAAMEYGSHNIRVNSVHPGFIETAMMSNAIDHESAVLDRIPLGRVGQPSEVANLVLFLASDKSSFITGTEHIIDGGMIIG